MLWLRYPNGTWIIALTCTEVNQWLRKELSVSSSPTAEQLIFIQEAKKDLLFSNPKNIDMEDTLLRHTILPCSPPGLGSKLWDIKGWQKRSGNLGLLFPLSPTAQQLGQQTLLPIQQILPSHFSPSHSKEISRHTHTHTLFSQEKQEPSAVRAVALQGTANQQKHGTTVAMGNWLPASLPRPGRARLCWSLSE